MFSLRWLFLISVPPLIGKDKSSGKIRISWKNINISTPSCTDASPNDHLYSTCLHEIWDESAVYKKGYYVGRLLNTKGYWEQYFLY